ncbi:hypothetical protein GCM10018785_27220 [Streptomyces longispororuber]|uniref:Uncharacterized protein n=1 Tax=Streptomyces longispororuber TaxID=68230 RepID=A0A918ZJQ3_9ACTN|nr:hypothetical protein [Streptomyces longispororuber]GHE56469.1 hypothetical protein GCM10018785_27220 [Streptomyces longispororuber]
MTASTPDDLYARYMAAHAALREHGETCTGCSADALCEKARRLGESFERLQDAYLARQSKQRR